MKTDRPIDFLLGNLELIRDSKKIPSDILLNINALNDQLDKYIASKTIVLSPSSLVSSSEVSSRLLKVFKHKGR